MRRWLIALCVLAAGSCVGDTVPSPSPPTSTGTPAQSLEPPIAEPRLVGFDLSGLWLSTDAPGTRLTFEPVAWAAADAMGGFVVFLEDGGPGLHWLKAGTTSLERLPYRSGFPAVVGGRPSLLSGVWDEGRCEIEQLFVLVDLASGTEESLGCFGGEDGGIWQNRPWRCP